MQIWRIVPLEGERGCHRRLAPEEYLQARLVVRKVRYADDDLAAYPQGLFEHGLRFAYLLEALVENDVVEGLIVIFRQAGIYVPVQDGQSAGNTLVDAA